MSRNRRFFLFFLQEDHSLLNYERTHLGVDFQLQVLRSLLSVWKFPHGIQSRGTNFSGGGSTDINYANLSRSTLISRFDPAIFFLEKSSNRF
jgi:hypothetical protein